MRTHKKILATLLAVVLCLAAGTTFAESSETPVTINFWHHYSAQSAENETLMNVLIPQFESENPGIKVNAVSHEWAELHDKVLVSAGSNSLPDVARCDIAWLPEFQKMGVLVALDQEMPNFADVSATLLDSAMSTAKIGDHSYALALNTNSKILFYNTAMLEAAGVAVPTTMKIGNKGWRQAANHSPPGRDRIAHGNHIIANLLGFLRAYHKTAAAQYTLIR